MANARFVDALVGYRYFLARRGDARLADVNRFLKNSGRSPVSERTFRHYQKLVANGFTGYIPINQFDVFHALGRLQAASDRRRHKRTAADLIAQLRVVRGPWRNGVVVDASAVGFGIALQEPFRSALPAMGWLRIPNYKDVPVVVVWQKRVDGSLRVGLRATQYVYKYRSPEQPVEAKAAARFRITRPARRRLDWDDFIRVTSRTHELIAATTDFLAALAEALETELEVDPPVVEEIRYGSPGKLDVKIDAGVAEVLQVLFEFVFFYKLKKKELRARTANQEIAAVNLTLEAMRNAIKLEKESQEPGVSEGLASAVRELVPRLFKGRSVPTGLLSVGTPERGILEERMIPASAELSAGDDVDYEIDIEGP